MWAMRLCDSHFQGEGKTHIISPTHDGQGTMYGLCGIRLKDKRSKNWAMMQIKAIEMFGIVQMCQYCMHEYRHLSGTVRYNALEKEAERRGFLD